MKSENEQLRKKKDMKNNT